MCEPEAGAAADAHHGVAGHLSATWHQPAGAGASGLSLPVGKDQSYPAQPGVGGRHHLLAHGPGLYLVAIMDWHSRYVVAWRLSNTLEADFCVDALKEALGQGQPEVFNTDQGSQFTSLEFTQVLQEHGVKISMDGKGRYNGNIFVERLWRIVKYEEVYLKAYANGTEARRELSVYFRFYNDQRPHQALGYRTPAEMFHEARNATGNSSKVTEGPPERVLVSLGSAAGLSLNSTPVLSSFLGPPHCLHFSISNNGWATALAKAQGTALPIWRVTFDLAPGK